jgi:hypothetical protein
VGGITSNTNSLGGAITACFNAGDVTAGSDPGAGDKAKGKVFAGGIGGRPYVSSITACSNTGAVTAKGHFAGGIVGSITNRGTNDIILTACVNTGAVRAEGNFAGGIAGEIRSINPGAAGIKEVFVKACFNTGVVRAEGSPVHMWEVTNYNPFVYVVTQDTFVTAGGITGGIQREGHQGTIACYWLPGGNVVYGNAIRMNIGSYHELTIDEPTNPGVQDGVIELSGSDWPTTGTDPNWGIGNADGSGPGHYWKDLGSWNSGGASIVPPKLYWEP